MDVMGRGTRERCGARRGIPTIDRDDFSHIGGVDECKRDRMEEDITTGYLSKREVVDVVCRR